MIKKYVIDNLPRKLKEIQNTFRSGELPMLTDYEKAIIYDYTENGYESANKSLRFTNGQNPDQYCKLLNKSLKKLPDYRRLCYRAVFLTHVEKQKYTDAFASSTTITEASFTSCSTSRLTAMMFSPYNVLFVIHSKHGKSIENIAKFGIVSGQNEKEIIFAFNSKFSILNIESENGILLITIEEL